MPTETLTARQPKSWRSVMECGGEL